MLLIGNILQQLLLNTPCK